MGCFLNVTGTWVDRTEITALGDHETQWHIEDRSTSVAVSVAVDSIRRAEPHPNDAARVILLLHDGRMFSTFRPLPEATPAPVI